MFSFYQALCSSSREYARDEALLSIRCGANPEYMHPFNVREKIENLHLVQHCNFCLLTVARIFEVRLEMHRRDSRRHVRLKSCR